MRLLRTYADRTAAELDLDLLRANRIDAVLDAAGGAIAGGPEQEMRLSVPADQHLPALAILTDEAESHAQLPAAARPAGAVQRTVVVLIRAAALFFIVNALLYLAAIGERMRQGGAPPPATTEPQRGGVQQDIARLATHALVGGLLLAYAETLAGVICRGRRRHRERADGVP
jgi:hypothetical protein